MGQDLSCESLESSMVIGGLGEVEDSIAQAGFTPWAELFDQLFGCSGKLREVQQSPFNLLPTQKLAKVLAHPLQSVGYGRLGLLADNVEVGAPDDLVEVTPNITTML
jgi:hypothetical protein